MKDKLSGFLAALFAICLCLCVICFVIESVSFDTEYHKQIIERQYIEDTLNMNDEQVDSTLLSIVKYIRGDSDNMQQQTKAGELFNERELTHMEDVQKLFRFCSFLKVGCIGFCMVLFIVIYALNGKYSFRIIAKGCVLTMISMIGVVILLGLWYMIDFEGFWTAFHKVAFTNDLWLMMPTDAIIIFYSLEFFTAVVRRIIERMAIIFGGIFICGLLGWLILPKKRRRSF